MSDPEAPPLPGEPAASQSSGAVDLIVDGSPADLPIEALAVWTNRLLTDLAPTADSFVVRLTDSGTAQALNRRYRDKDAATDVLSFPGAVTPEGEHLGDVSIAVPVAAGQATEAGRSLEEEIKVLILHGLLHCIGYDHETDDGEMAARETELRREWIDSHA